MKGEKRNIEWSQASWNWMSGCPGPGGVHCKGCYAKAMATRLRGRYGYPKGDPMQVVLHPDKMWGHQPTHLPFWATIPRPHPDMEGWATWTIGQSKRWTHHPMLRRKPTVYFSVSMGDWMFAEENWRKEALGIMRDCPQHIFVTLTKQYYALSYVSWQNIPKNVIIGISVTNREQVQGIDALRLVPAFTRLVCFEPLLEDVAEHVNLTGIHWIIIGKRTRQGKTPGFTPEKEWVDKLAAKARELNIPVFLKPSMTVTEGWETVQETPYARIREAFRLEGARQERLG